MLKKYIMIRVPTDLIQQIQLVADSKQRSVPKQVEYLLRKALENVDNTEDGYSLQDFKDGKPQADIKKLSGIPDVFTGPGFVTKKLEYVYCNKCHMDVSLPHGHLKF